MPVTHAATLTGSDNSNFQVSKNVWNSASSHTANISLASEVSGVLPVANGGTNATTPAGALANLIGNNLALAGTVSSNTGLFANVTTNGGLNVVAANGSPIAGFGSNGAFVTNSVSTATILGTVTRKLAIYGGNGSVIGYLPLYDSII